MLWQHPDYYVTYILQQNGGSNAATDICDGGSLRPVWIPDQSNAHWNGAKAAKLNIDVILKIKTSQWNGITDKQIT